MEIWIGLYNLLMRMPPVGSAVISLACCIIVWIGGKRILSEMKTQNDPIMHALSGQSTKMEEQSNALQSIRIQTTKTNGSVLLLEKTIETHEGLDNERHEDTKDRLKTNQTGIHKLRDQVSILATDVLTQNKRINSRDDSIGEGSGRDL